MIGNVFIGRTDTGWSGGMWSRRDLHISAGLPLTSALHEPHFAALQFHRTARSGAAWAWIQWSASRTTMPSSTGTWNSTYREAWPGSPRKTRIVIIGIRHRRRPWPAPEAHPGARRWDWWSRASLLLLRRSHC